MIIWKYKKHGTCQSCPNDDARLYIPINVPNMRVITPPELCPACQAKFEKLLESGVTAEEVVKQMRKRGT